MKQSILILLTVIAWSGPFHNIAAAEVSTNRPLLAIWRDSEGLHRDSGAPYLRVAIWNDGRMVFAKDPGKWSHELLEGRLDTNEVAELKQAVDKTGVFELKGNCYLVPDAPVDCVMVEVGSKQQMLYWDERETPGYGINIAPKEQHLNFIRCWKEVNHLALNAIPKESQPYTNRFQRPPQSWRLKKPIQSE